MNKKRTALIRANGSKKIGMGHLSRASLIVEMFQANNVDARIVLQEDEDAKQFLSSRTEHFECLPRGISFSEEIEQLRKLVASSSAFVFVLDMLNYDDYSEFLRSLKDPGCVSVVIFDEAEKKRIDADIVLNGNPCQLGNDYSGYPGRYLVGPRYFIVDSQYKNSFVSAPRQIVRNLLVTVGGADHNDLLFKLIDGLETMGGKYHANIFSTSSTGYLDRLKERLSRSRLSHDLFLNEKTLVPFWSRNDAAITAGGNTLFERIATRLPGATLCQIDLQVKIADAFEKLGVNHNLGHGMKINAKELTGELGRFLTDFEAHKNQYDKSAGIVDGRGLDYLMEAIDELRRAG